MSTVDAKLGEFPVHFDELAPDGQIVARKATFEAVSALYKDACSEIVNLHLKLDEVTAQAAKFKQERDSNWNALQAEKNKKKGE